MMVDTSGFGLTSLPNQLRIKPQTIKIPHIPKKINYKVPKHEDSAIIVQNINSIKDHFRKIKTYHIKDLKSDG